MKIIQWIKPSFEDAHGTASYRRISAFIFVVLICFMVFCDKIKTTESLHAFYALLVTFLLLVGIITTQNILTFFNKKEEPPKDEKQINDGDSVIISKE